MKDPRISIVIPSLNQRAFLERAVGSVLEQDYPHRELIVIDGGSRDGSAELLATLAPHLAFWQSRPDAGPADALRQGCARATGDVLAVLNADDFYLPGALSRMAAAFGAQPDADVISAHGYLTSPSGTLGVPLFSDSWDPVRFSYGGCVLLQPSTFFRREAYERAGGFRLSGSLCWDMELWASLAAAGSQFRTANFFITGFRLHADSITGREQLMSARREHARRVMAEVRGRPENLWDRWRHLWVRISKFAGHPLRTFRQRWYVHSVLGRWSL
jgi:glycosyltransferase involved in cell wall biosynthesis